MTTVQRESAPHEPWATLVVAAVALLGSVPLYFATGIAMYGVSKMCPVGLKCTPAIWVDLMMLLMLVLPLLLGLAGIVAGIVLVARKRQGWRWALAGVVAGTVCWLAGLAIRIFTS